MDQKRTPDAGEAEAEAPTDRVEADAPAVQGGEPGSTPAEGEAKPRSKT